MFDVPSGVEVGKRIGADRKEYWIILNHKLYEQVVPLPWPAYDHLAEMDVEDELALMPYGVAVLSKRQKIET